MASNIPLITRRELVVAMSVFAVGCAQDDSSDDGATPTVTDEPDSNGDDVGMPVTGEVTQIGALTLTSPAFDDGERIPEKYAYAEDNVNPPLVIDHVPEAARSLALVVDDPDAVEPAGSVWEHWVVWNIPPDTSTIPEDWSPDVAVEGTNDYGSTGYGGPNPPDTEHRYRFKLFALDTTLDLSRETDAEALEAAVVDHVVEQTQLVGTYPA